MARRLAELPGALIDLVNRHTVGFFTRRNEILAGRVDPDAARLGFGCKIGHVSELARSRRDGEQSDLVSGALGRIEELARARPGYRRPRLSGSRPSP